MKKLVFLFVLSFFAASVLHAGFLSKAADAQEKAANPTATATATSTSAAIAIIHVKIIMKDGSIITGALVGSTADQVFVEKTKGKAITIKKSDIQAAFDADSGKEISFGAGAEATAVSANDNSDSEDNGEKAEKNTGRKQKAGKGGKALATDEEAMPKNYFEIFAYGSLNNSFNIGTPLQQWMGDDIQSGSPAFANVGGIMFLGIDDENTMFLGVGMSMNLPPSHSIWGSNLYYGGRDELVLNPYILSLDIPFRYAFKGIDGFSLTVEPSLLMAFLTGYYTLGTGHNLVVNGVTLYPPDTFPANMGSMGVGFGMSLGAEYYFGMFGLGAKFGFRMLQSALNYDSTAAGPWSPTDGSGNVIGIDLGGSYMTIGIMMKFGS